MNLTQQCVDGEIQIRDEDTDNRDIMAIVPLTGDEEYDKETMMPFVYLLCSAPEMQTLLQAIPRLAATVEGGPQALDRIRAQWGGET